jgi:RNA polymerase sigma-70 factor (ECF subfamily)
MTTPADNADPQLDLARAGSLDAFGEALQGCRRYLLMIAGSHLDPDLQAKGGASDLVQQTFLEAQRNFAAFTGNSQAELRLWLRRLLLNNLGDFSRTYRATKKRTVSREVPLGADGSSQHRAQEPAASMPSPSGHAIEREESAAMEAVLARLPEDYQQVIHLRYREGRSFEEIGRLMNRSADACRKLWIRAMERLRREWENDP